MYIPILIHTTHAVMQSACVYVIYTYTGNAIGSARDGVCVFRPVWPQSSSKTLPAETTPSQGHRSFDTDKENGNQSGNSFPSTNLRGRHSREPTREQGSKRTSRQAEEVATIFNWLLQHLLIFLYTTYTTLFCTGRVRNSCRGYCKRE